MKILFEAMIFMQLVKPMILNMHASPIVVGRENICLSCKERRVDAPDDYKNILSGKCFSNNAPNRKLQYHFICSDCLSREFKDGKHLFNVSCPGCGMMIDYKNAVECVKRVIRDGANSENSGLEIKELIYSMVGTMISEIGPQTLIYSLEIPTARELERFLDYFEDLKGDSACALFKARIKELSPLYSRITEDSEALMDRLVRDNRYMSEELFLKTLMFSLTNGVDEDRNKVNAGEELEEFLNLFKKIGSGDIGPSENRTAYLNSRMLSVISQPNIPIESAVGFFIPYLTDNKSYQNSLMKRYVSTYLYLYEGTHRRYELIFGSMIKYGCRFNRKDENRLVQEYMLEIKSSLTTLCGLLHYISGVLAGVFAGVLEFEGRKKSKDMFIFIVDSVLSRISDCRIEYCNILQINNLVKAFPFMKARLDCLSIRFLSTAGSSNLPPPILDKIDEFIKHGDGEGMGELLMLYEDPLLLKMRHALFCRLASIPKPMFMRAFSFLKFVNHEISSGKFSGYLHEAQACSFELYLGYLHAITFYMVQRIIFLDKEKFSSVDSMLIERLSAEFLKLQESADRIRCFAGNTDLLCAYAFAHTYSLYVRPFLFNQKMNFHVDLCFLRNADCEAMYKFLVSMLLSSQNLAYTQALHLTISSICPVLLERGVNIEIHPTDLNEIVKKLIWASLNPVLVCTEYLFKNAGFQRIGKRCEDVVVVEYFKYCYFLRSLSLQEMGGAAGHVLGIKEVARSLLLKYAPSTFLETFKTLESLDGVLEDIMASLLQCVPGGPNDFPEEDLGVLISLIIDSAIQNKLLLKDGSSTLYSTVEAWVEILNRNRSTLHERVMI